MAQHIEMNKDAAIEFAHKLLGAALGQRTDIWDGEHEIIYTVREYES